MFPKHAFSQLLNQNPLHSIHAKLIMQPFNSRHLISRHTQTLARETTQPLSPTFSPLPSQILTQISPFLFYSTFNRSAHISVSFIVMTKLHGFRETLPPSTQHPHTPFIPGFYNLTHQILPFSSLVKYNLLSLPSSVAWAPQ